MDHEFPSYSDVEEEVLSYLRNHASVSGDSFVTSGALPLNLGIGRQFHESARGLFIDGITLAPAVRRLRHLLPPPDEATDAPSTYFADRKAVQEANDRGYNPVLYRAYRDVLPPRSKKLSGCRTPVRPGNTAAEDATSWWYADLVVYLPGLLPGREPYRSTGHWNSDAQLEIFQTLSGKVLLLTGSRSSENQVCVMYQICRSGDMSVIPFGSWHLTYCLDGPAGVFNIYTDMPSLSSGVIHSSREAALNESIKYTARPPVEIAAALESEAIRFVCSDMHTTPPREMTSPSWIHRYVNDSNNLSSLYLFAKNELIEALEQTALSELG